jgi:hypothetical protein
VFIEQVALLPTMVCLLSKGGAVNKGVFIEKVAVLSTVVRLLIKWPCCQQLCVY